MTRAPAGQQAWVVRHLMATLAGAGVRHIVVSPGSRSTPLVQAAAERPEFQLHTVLDERAAGFVALGLYRATGQLAATLCTSGSAAAHVLPAAIEATESGDALVAITADRPASVRGWGASQAILQVGLLAPYAEHQAEIDPMADDVGSRLALLVHQVDALPSHGGCVHVNVPLALPLALPPGALPPPAQPMAPQPPPPPPQIDPPQPGERVLLLLGPLPHVRGLATFLAPRCLPHLIVWAEPASRLRDALPSMRHADALLRDAGLRATLLPDRIVRVGAWPVAKGAQLLLEDMKRLGRPVDVVHPRRKSDPLQQNRQTLIADIAGALSTWRLRVESVPSLPENIPDAPSLAWAERWRRADAAVELPAAPWQEPAVIAALAHSLPAGATLFLGNSMPLRDWESFAPPLPPDVQVEVSRGAAGIDGALATLAGLARGRQQPLVAYLGDCTFLHDVGSLQLLAPGRWQHAGIRVCVVDNDGGAIFDYLPARQQMSDDLHVHCFTLPHGLDLAAIARGFGIPATTCSDLPALHHALAQPLRPGQVELIVVRVARDLGEALHHAHWQAAAAAARKALP